MPCLGPVHLGREVGLALGGAPVGVAVVHRVVVEEGSLLTLVPASRLVLDVFAPGGKEAQGQHASSVAALFTP